MLENGTEIKLPTETIFRDGESPAGRSAAKIGGAAVGGAILGAIMGGGKGAVIGAASGAGGGTGWAMAGDRQPAELRAGQSLTVRVSESVTTRPSWGQTLNQGIGFFDNYPLYLYQPLFAIVAIVLALNLLGDALRDALDPKTRR